MPAPHTRRFTATIVLVIALAVTVVAQAQRHGGTLTVAYPNDPVTFDTMVNISPPREVRSLVFEPLVDFDATFTPQPTLAHAWEISDDGLSWTFFLRDDVVFHDGQPMTAADVVASFGRLQSAGNRRGEFARVTSAEALDDHTVRFDLSSPWAAFTESLAMPGGGLTIYPAWVVEKWGDTMLSDDFIGTGPYRVTEVVPGERYVLDRFDGYVSPPGEPSHLAGARHAYADRIVIVPIPDSSTRVAALLTGEVDVAVSVPLDDLARLDADSNIRTTIVEPGYRIYLKLNAHEGPFANLTLRQAVRTAIDPEEVMFTQGPEGFWRVNTTPRFQQGMWMWDDATDALYPADLEAGRQLVAASGYAGERVRFMATPGRPMEFVTVIVIEELLRDLGLNVEVVSVDSATYAQRRSDPTQWEIKISGGTPVSPVSYLNASVVDRRGVRWPWVPPEWDTFMGITQENPDQDARREALLGLYTILAEGVGELWLGDVFGFTGSRINVHGVPSDGGDMVWLANVWKE